MGGRDHSCEVCGHGGFNDPHGDCICEPAPDPFTDEDREFLEEQIVAYRANTFADCFSGEDAEALARALAHIDHLEKQQLERAETISRFSKARLAEADRADHLERALREIAALIGAALRTSEDDARFWARTNAYIDKHLPSEDGG